ncbi:NADH dehydrogenase (ubiquinone) Fe-S protein 4 [Rhodotorula toruloides]|uniref:NADH dehydrogenase [ubiquinone] iron-sulfur protein 4, mitochondrial n=1 Tax=Rhodotorula toruloides TaxID=5286 RepID=A0A511KIU8_RHOTO|nr:NADH dehydrogenase (ubiquinone) Fe-S protein 4 [Rhodotorula toruloides]
MLSLRLPTLRSKARTFASTARAATNIPVRAVEAEGQSHVPAERPEGAVTQAGVVSGAPDELHRRPIRIYRPAPSPTSSAKGTSHHWRIDWDILQGAGRWENPLMGWASSGDYMQGTHLKVGPSLLTRLLRMLTLCIHTQFNSKEDAIVFAEKQGWEYYCQEPQVQKFVTKSYANNYGYQPKKLRIHHTK